MPERSGLFPRGLLTSEIGKGTKWHKSFSAEFQIQARFFQAPTMFKTPCRDVLENLKSWLNPQNFESNGWKRKMSILRLPLEMVEVFHSNWQVWLFPSKFGVFMCCPASTAGQMELRKARVTVLFVSVECFVCHVPLSHSLLFLCNSPLQRHWNG